MVSTLKSQASESGSSDSSDSEEESPAAQKQRPQAGKSPGSSQDPSPASFWVSDSPLLVEQLMLWAATESNSVTVTISHAFSAVKTNSVPQPTSVKKAPASAPAAASLAADSSDDSSEESDSEDEIVPPSQVRSH